MANAWVLALGIAGSIDLGRVANFGEIYTHLSDEPRLVLIVTIAVLLGCVAANPNTESRSDWGEKHPLLTQALVGAALAALFLAMYWATTALR